MDADPELPPPGGGFGAARSPGKTGEAPYPLAPLPPAVDPAVAARRSSVTIAILLLVTVPIGAVAGLGAYSFMKFKRDVRNAQGQMGVRSIADAAVDAYDRTGHLCPSAAPIPPRIDLVAGKSYEADGHDWADDPGWRCLSFDDMGPLVYQFRYDATPEGFTATATGDTDGDGIRATWVVTGRLVPSPDGGVPQLVRGPIVETNPGE